MKYLLSLLTALFVAMTFSSCASQAEANRQLSPQPFNVPAEWERQGGGTALGGALRNSSIE